MRWTSECDAQSGRCDIMKGRVRGTVQTSFVTGELTDDILGFPKL